MKANEFRVGNLVKYRNDDKVKPKLRKTYKQITADDILFFTEDEERANIAVEAIELTEDVLLKCGFEYIDDIPIYKAKDFEIRLVFFDVWHFVYENYKTGEDMCFKMGYNLHDLQNAFYVILGEELEVNL